MALTGTYLQRSRHDSVFYFRRRVPQDLHRCFSGRMLQLTLRTTDRRDAIMKARALATESDRLFREIREQMKRSKRAPKVDACSVVWALALADDKKTLRFTVDAGDSPEDVRAGQAAFVAASAFMPGTDARGDADRAAPLRKPVISLGRLVDEFLATRTSSKTVRAYRTALSSEFGGLFGFRFG